MRLAAQAPAVAAGRVVRLERGDSVPVTGAEVVLHRIGRAEQGPIDSTRSGPGGRFRFRFATDTAALYLLSASYSGIEYFSPPVHTNPVLPDTALVIIVSDTSLTAPVEAEARHVVVSRPGSDGSRSVLEIVILTNAGDRTRVSRDSSNASWGASLPAGVIGFQAGQGDFSPDAVIDRGDSVLVFAPIAPGEKQLIYSYTLPADHRTLAFPAGARADSLNVLLEEFDATVSGGGLVRADSQVIEGRHFQRWTAATPTEGPVTIRFSSSGGKRWLLPALVAAVGLVLVLAAGLLRRQHRAVPMPVSESRERLLEAIARLDARYAGREGQVPPVEWAEYQAERARLKADLTAALAVRGPTS